MAILKLQNFSVPPLQPIELLIEPGQCVCISGDSGSGKSLLLRAIADLIPHMGEALIDDVSQNEILPNVWRKRVGMLPAENHFWFETVSPHFAEPNKNWFEMLGFEMDVLNWSIERLSSGEKQRLALLRLLCNLPEVLLLDEPSANLDKTNTLAIEALVKKYSEEKQASILWVSHDEAQIARVANQHYVLQSGSLREVMA